MPKADTFWTSCGDVTWLRGRVSGSAPALGRTATRPRGAIGHNRRKAVGIFQVGRGAHPTAPEAGALPETGRYRAIFRKPKKNWHLA